MRSSVGSYAYPQQFIGELISTIFPGWFGVSKRTYSNAFFTSPIKETMYRLKRRDISNKTGAARYILL